MIVLLRAPLLLCLVTLASISAPAIVQAAPLIPKIDLQIEGDIGKPVISGKTNLPDGTELFVSIEGKFNSYIGQKKATVAVGRFRAGPFSQNSSKIKPGRYILMITTPLTQFQPPNVAKVFGTKGVNLKGPLVKQSLGLGNMIEYQTPYVVGGNTGASEQNDHINKVISEGKKLAQAIQSELHKGDLLLRSNPSNNAIGQQTKRLSAVTDKAISTLRDSIPECASMASAAWPFWWYGMVAVHNHGSTAAQDYATYRADYEKQLQMCKTALKS